MERVLTARERSALDLLYGGATVEVDAIQRITPEMADAVLASWVAFRDGWAFEPDLSERENENELWSAWIETSNDAGSPLARAIAGLWG